MKKILMSLIVASMLLVSVGIVVAVKPANAGTCTLANGDVVPRGFDEYGYNRCAHQFVGTGMSWCMEKIGDLAWCTDYLEDYANDKLVMKWNEEWDRGNAEGWNDPNGYDAWENNEWNGLVPGGSGETEHFKTVWIGADACSELTGEEYCIWGQFLVLQDFYGPGQPEGLTHITPSGYGAY